MWVIKWNMEFRIIRKRFPAEAGGCEGKSLFCEILTAYSSLICIVSHFKVHNYLFWREDPTAWTSEKRRGTTELSSQSRPKLPSRYFYYLGNIVKVLLHKGGFCNGCITKQCLFIAVHHSTNVFKIDHWQKMKLIQFFYCDILNNMVFMYWCENLLDQNTL